MNPTKFEYHNKDTVMLRKDVAFRIAFSLLFFVAFVAQLFTFIYFHVKFSLNALMIIVSIVVMVMSLSLVAICFAYAFKDLRIINTVKKKGSCVSSVMIFMSIKKDSFLRLYYIINLVIAYGMLAFFAGAVTYSILNFIYYDVLTFYLPLLFFMVLTGFHTVLHLKYEINVMRNVQKYISIY